MTYDIKQYWDLSDDDLRQLYDQALKDELLDRVAYDAKLNRSLFPLFARRAECFCGLRAGGRWNGFFYLSRFEGATARLHLALPGSAVPAAAVRQVLDWCFETFEFKSLFIVAPAGDAQAAALWPALGAERLADIPGLCWLENRKKNVPGRLFVMRPTACN